MRLLEEGISELLDRGETFALATVLSQQGSTPRLPGARMVVRSDGSILGTIGGGLLEAKVMEKAGQVLADGMLRQEDFDLTGAIAQGLDMICGGRTAVLVEPLAPTPVNREVFRALGEARAKGDTAWLVSRLPRPGSAEALERALYLPAQNRLVDPAGLGEALVTGLMQQTRGVRWPLVLEERGAAYLLEPFLTTGTLYIFGGGHVGLSLARVGALLDFRLAVMDDRAEFANPERFPMAQEVLVRDYRRALEGLEVDRESYMVIVTRGHSHDKTVLALALRTQARYVGMIGSLRKRDQIYARLMEEGFTREDLARVHSPVGLAIGAETPEEIAVSIAAELVQARAGLL